MKPGSTWKKYDWNCRKIDVEFNLIFGNDETDGTGSQVQYFLRAQAVKNSYQHAMRSSSQTVIRARRLMNEFIESKVAESYKHSDKARALVKKFDIGNNLVDYANAKTHINVAIRRMGNAQHPVADETSPMHAGFQVWDGLLHWYDALQHKKGESRAIYLKEMPRPYLAVKRKFEKHLDYVLAE